MDLFLKSSLRTSFGGAGKKGNPKMARPVSTKHFMHVVLKSEKARGAYSFLRYERQMLVLARQLARRFRLEIKDMVIMSNHIHLSIKCFGRKSLANFLRVFSGIIARKILMAEKGRASRVREFFSGRPFSRIVVNGKKSCVILKNYFELNRLEKLGWSKKESRKLRLLERKTLEVPIFV